MNKVYQLAIRWPGQHWHSPTDLIFTSELKAIAFGAGLTNSGRIKGFIVRHIEISDELTVEQVLRNWETQS